jgi:shikimate dehydrogenase
MGAVNCVVRRQGQLIGENTDGKGFLKSLCEVIDPRDRSIVLLGAGGAARAIAVELGLAGVRQITVVNRDEARGTELVALLSEKMGLSAQWLPWHEDLTVPADAEVLINATSIGLYDPDARVPLAVSSLRPDLVVADVIFSPPRTRLIRDAESRGCRAIDGLGMIVNQGVISVEFWTGVSPDPTVMRKAVEQALGI